MVRVIISLVLLISPCVMAITIGTYNLPPFSMDEDGDIIGMATEIVHTLLSRADINNNKFLVYPLARGLAELRADRIDMFYPYVITEYTNLEKYILIGPIAKYSVALFVRNNYKNDVNLSAMQKQIVGAVRGSIEDDIISSFDLHVDSASNGVSCLRMVLAERISACAIGTLPGQYAAAINNLAPKMRFNETGEFADIYVALNTNMDSDKIASIKRAFDQLLQANYFVEEQAEYEKKFNIFIETLS